MHYGHSVVMGNRTWSLFALALDLKVKNYLRKFLRLNLWRKWVQNKCKNVWRKTSRIFEKYDRIFSKMISVFLFLFCSITSERLLMMKFFIEIQSVKLWHKWFHRKIFDFPLLNCFSVLKIKKFTWKDLNYSNRDIQGFKSNSEKKNKTAKENGIEFRFSPFCSSLVRSLFYLLFSIFLILIIVYLEKRHKYLWLKFM